MTSRAVIDPACTPAAHQGPLVRAASFFSLAAAALAISGCSIVLDPDPCPEVLCAAGCSVVEDEDGCGTCACEPDPEPEVCFTDDDCSSEQRCDTENYCEAPPGCTDGEPCPTVCYGRCVDAPTGCSADADCADGERCRFGTPATGDGALPPEDARDAAPEQLPAETGVCVPAECPDTLALPACPPGTELVVDFDDNPCGEARCVPSQGNCRDLDPATCEDTLGCHLEEIAGGCDCATPGDGEADMACLCAPIVEVICVEDEGCAGLDPEACAANPDCAGERYVGGCAEDIAPACDDNEVDCPEAFPCDPVEEFVCLPRHDDGCFGGADCPPGTICMQETVCTEVCWEAEDGTSGCESECWLGEGYCAPSTEDCWSLPVDVCEERPDCMVDWVSPGCFCDPDDANCGCPDIAEAVCVPVPQQDCYSDADCGPGQFCDVEVFCPDCGDGNDLDCAAPCFVEGVCRDGGPPPVGCATDNDCGPGYACESLTVCEECAAPGPDGDPAPPCTGACWEEGICVWTGGPGEYCYSDDDCTGGARCNIDLCLNDPNCPECDVCVGLCEEPNPGGCFSDVDCAGDQVCDTVNYCDPSPDCVDGEPCDAVCYGRCVDPDLPGEECYSDADCGDGMICEYLDEGCAGMGDPGNGSGLIACLGMCIVVEEPPPPECFTDDDCEQLGPGWMCLQDEGCDPNVDFCPSACVQVTDCAAVITYAVNPETQSCVAFSTPCDVPEGWETVESCDMAGGN